DAHAMVDEPGDVTAAAPCQRQMLLGLGRGLHRPGRLHRSAGVLVAGLLESLFELLAGLLELLHRLLLLPPGRQGALDSFTLLFPPWDHALPLLLALAVGTALIPPRPRRRRSGHPWGASRPAPALAYSRNDLQSARRHHPIVRDRLPLLHLAERLGDELPHLA